MKISGLRILVRNHLLNLQFFTIISLDATTAYPKSKTLAERAVWDFIDSLPEGAEFDAVTINPGFILGPILGKTFLC